MLSVILPAYNEEKTVSTSATVLSKILLDNNIDYELIFVDDGSTDNTWNEIKKVYNDHVRAIKFSRNFGKESAIFAGLSISSGDCCAVMDIDLQHPPEKLVEMYRLWEDGYEVIEGIKLSRGDESKVHRSLTTLFYSIISKATGFDMQNSSDFKLLDRKVVNSLNSMTERGVFFRALSFWLGYRRTTVGYHVQERIAGESKWSTNSLFKYALRNITSFSSAPMQIVTWIGAIFSIFAIILGVQTLINKVSGKALDGFTTIILIQLAGTGLIMFSLGIIGYYIARMYDEIKHRPRYIISDVLPDKSA